MELPKILKDKYVRLAIVLLTVVILDQWTKLLIVRHFALGESVSLIPSFFNLTYVRNTGAAFSLLHNAPDAFRVPFFILMPLVILSVVMYFFVKLPPSKFLAGLALSLIIGGAIGNLIDRVRLGYVVDFLHAHWKYVYTWPMFNVADSCIVVGVGILFLESLLSKSEASAVPGTKEASKVRSND
jgi:signal peptidase II